MGGSTQQPPSQTVIPTVYPGDHLNLGDLDAPTGRDPYALMRAIYGNAPWGGRPYTPPASKAAAQAAAAGLKADDFSKLIGNGGGGDKKSSSKDDDSKPDNTPVAVPGAALFPGVVSTPGNIMEPGQGTAMGPPVLRYPNGPGGDVSSDAVRAILAANPNAFRGLI